MDLIELTTNKIDASLPSLDWLCLYDENCISIVKDPLDILDWFFVMDEPCITNHEYFDLDLNQTINTIINEQGRINSIDLIQYRSPTYKKAKKVKAVKEPKVKKVHSANL